jgi:CheY-like chemotaxis protein
MTSARAADRPVIIIDDSPDDVLFIRRLHAKAGIGNPVLTFLSSEDARDHLTALARRVERHADIFPSVIIVDRRMPRCDGFELLEWLRKQPAFAAVRVVILSSSEGRQDRDHALGLGADHYLPKFPSPDALARLVAGTR